MKFELNSVAQAIPVSLKQPGLWVGLSINTAAELLHRGFTFVIAGTYASLLTQDTNLLIKQTKGVMQ